MFNIRYYNFIFVWMFTIESNKNICDYDLDGIPYCDDDDDIRLSPLVTSRGCYLELWNTEDPTAECLNETGLLLLLFLR